MFNDNASDQKESIIQGACVSPELQEILALKRKGFRTDEMKRNKNNITLFLRKEHVIPIKV